MNLNGLGPNGTKWGFNRRIPAQPVNVHLIFSTPAISRINSGPPTGSKTSINLSIWGFKSKLQESQKAKREKSNELDA